MHRLKFSWIIIATGAVLLSSCAGNNASSNDAKSASQSSTVTPKESIPAVGSSLEWLHTGGGNLEFTITKVSSGGYSFHVSRFYFQEMDTTLSLDSSDPMFSTVESIIDGSFKVPTFTPSGPTGTWLSIAITRDSETETISDADISDATLQSVDDWVRAGLPNSG